MAVSAASQAYSAPTRCPICGATKPLERLETYHDPLGAKDYVMHRCPDCEVIWAHPFRHPGPEWYSKFAPADSYEGLGTWRFDWFFKQNFRPGGRLLDVGCGTGNFLMAAKAQGYQVEGVDSNPAAAEAGKTRGLTIHAKTVDEFGAECPPQTFDVITLFDVIEHLEDPGSLVRIAAKLLKPGGGLLITTPNGYRPIPFGRDDFDSPPHHLSRWTPEALERFVNKQGFRTQAIYYSFLPVWEYSRFPIGKATKLVLKGTKRLLYGRQAETGTLTQLMEKRGGGAASAVIGDKSTRIKLIHAFEYMLAFVLNPLFFPVKLWYRLTVPKAGVTTCLLSVRD